MNQLLFRIVWIIFLCFLGFLVKVEAQQQVYELKGLVRDQNSALVSGLRLETDNKISSLTDINGEFQFSLPAGEYVITTDSIPANKFRAFIKITETGLNPGYLEFVVDSNVITCLENRSTTSPKIITSAQPIYPAAARAINAFGEVEVALRITPSGDVLTANAVRGHPLLRTASITAAKNFRFEPSETSVERDVQIIFVFLQGQTKKPGLIRYECPYRIIVANEVEPIDITTTQTP